MASGRFHFDRFILDPGNRLLTRDSLPVDLNARYLDALALLVREAGQLITKDRFLDDVWRGVPVTDEALTQCIKTLRRQLGDNAANPRLIETVPKHGYRFIAPVDAGPERPDEQASSGYDARQALLVGGAGTIGGGLAGVVVGLFYGFAGASQPLQPGMGAVSVLLVLVCLTIVAALIGAVGISFGIAAAGFVPGVATGRWPWSMVGGALGGLVVGAFAKLLGIDAFHLLLGRSPGDITGAAEGALLGGAIGLGAWLGQRGDASRSMIRGVTAASLAGATAGTIIPLAGGQMMGGSLDLLARSFPGSRLRLDQIGGLFGEAGFGPISHSFSGALEGLVFGGCIVGAMTIARRQLGSRA